MTNPLPLSDAIPNAILHLANKLSMTTPALASTIGANDKCITPDWPLSKSMHDSGDLPTLRSTSALPMKMSTTGADDNLFKPDCYRPDDRSCIASTSALPKTTAQAFATAADNELALPLTKSDDAVIKSGYFAAAPHPIESSISTRPTIRTGSVQLAPSDASAPDVFNDGQLRTTKVPFHIPFAPGEDDSAIGMVLDLPEGSTTGLFGRPSSPTRDSVRFSGGARRRNDSAGSISTSASERTPPSVHASLSLAEPAVYQASNSGPLSVITHHRDDNDVLSYATDKNNPLASKPSTSPVSPRFPPQSYRWEKVAPYTWEKVAPDGSRTPTPVTRGDRRSQDNSISPTPHLVRKSSFQQGSLTHRSPSTHSLRRDSSGGKSLVAQSCFVADHLLTNETGSSERLAVQGDGRTTASDTQSSPTSTSPILKRIKSAASSVTSTDRTPSPSTQRMAIPRRTPSSASKTPKVTSSAGKDS